jgi:hypothetical protein
MLMASFTMSARGFLWLPLTGLGLALTFFALGGVSPRSDSSSKMLSGSDSGSSSSESFFERFLGTTDFGLGPGLALAVVVFFATDLAAGAFFAAAALGLAF